MSSRMYSTRAGLRLTFTLDVLPIPKVALEEYSHVVDDDRVGFRSSERYVHALLVVQEAQIHRDNDVKNDEFVFPRSKVVDCQDRRQNRGQTLQLSTDDQKALQKFDFLCSIRDDHRDVALTLLNVTSVADQESENDVDIHVVEAEPDTVIPKGQGSSPP